MPLPNLISFSGYATAGKDAAADTLVEHDGFVKTYMSKPLEQALLTLNPFIVVHVKGLSVPVRYSEIHASIGYDESKKIPEVRRLLQIFGTEIGREMCGENVWLDQVFFEIGKLFAADQRVVLTGVRYHNELARVHAAGGGAVWIGRPGVNPVNTHSSDNTITAEDCDVVVINDGPLEDLYLNLQNELYKRGW